MEKVRKVYKYGTGEKIPNGAIYLFSIKNGLMEEASPKEYQYVWHYFLVEVDDD